MYIISICQVSGVKCLNKSSIRCMLYVIHTVHGTEGHMAVYGADCHPQNIIWTEAKLRFI